MSDRSVASPADVGMCERQIERARALVHEQVASGRSPSCQALVVRHGQTVLAETAGVQTPDGPPLTFDHAFPLASAGKPWLAALILQLAEEGAIGLHDRVDSIVPEINADGRNDDVLIRHLLTHTQGWEFGVTSETALRLMRGEFADPDAFDDAGREMMFRVAIEGPKLAPAGTIMRYSNAGYEVLAEIVRRCDGSSLHDALRRRLFGPLGTDRAGTICTGDDADLLVRRDPDLPLGRNFPGMKIDAPHALRGDNGAGSYWATADAMARFAQMILDGGRAGDSHILAPTSVRSMTTNQIPGVAADFGGITIPEASWSHGFSVFQERSFSYFAGGLVPEGAIGHPGAGGANFWIDIEHDLVGVWFEVVTEVSPVMEPMSGRNHVFQDIITAGILE